MTPLHQIFILFAISLLSNALTTIVSTQNLTSLTYDYAYRCIPKISRYSKVPKFIHCIHALNQLPRYEGQGSFHNGPPDDLFRLPVETTVETCTVGVELVHQGSTKEAGEWIILIDAALRSGRECLNPGMGIAPVKNTGVCVWYGKHRRIIVTMRYYEPDDYGVHVESA